ncbi:hypothetical protein Tco_0816010 [Tanacetum coccineum]
MFVSHITISSNSMDESVRSSASYVILTDSETTPIKAEALVVTPSKYHSGKATRDVVGDGVTSIKRRRRDQSSDGVRNMAMASGPG